MSISDLSGNLRRYMKIRGKSIAALAQETGLGTATISNILNGKSQPKSGNLIKITQALKVSLNDALVDAPEMKNIRFRAFKTMSAKEKAAKDQVVAETAQWLSDYAELEELLSLHKDYGLGDIKARDPVKAAQEVRNKLGVCKNSEPIVDLIGLIEKAGVKLRMYPFGFRKTNGLSVGPKDLGPAIIVNCGSELSVERQIFTLAHELGHLILHVGSYAKIETTENQKQENEANLFAGHLLLPDEALKKEWKNSTGLHWVDKILRIKRKFKVSYKTVLVRLSQMEGSKPLKDLLIGFAGDYQKKYHHDLKNNYEPEAIVDPVADFDPESLGRSDLVEGRFLRLVRMAYEQGRISISRAAEILHLSLLEMREMAKSWHDEPILK